MQTLKQTGLCHIRISWQIPLQTCLLDSLTLTSIPHRAAWSAYSVFLERSSPLGTWISRNWDCIESCKCWDKFVVCLSTVDCERSSNTNIWYLQRGAVFMVSSNKIHMIFFMKLGTTKGAWQFHWPPNINLVHYPQVNLQSKLLHWYSQVRAIEHIHTW